MDIKQLRYFVAVVEEESFSRASNRVHVAQPALSLQVRKLEDELQTTLLIRSQQGVRPTEAGQLLLMRARNILTSVTQTVDDVRSLGREPSGTVRIGLPGTISAILTVPLIARVRQSFPGIKIIVAEAMSGFVREWLEEHRIDLAILYSEKQETGLVSKPLVREELVMLIPADAADKIQTAEQALAELPLILPSEAHGLRIMLEQKMRKRKIAIDPSIEVDSYHNITSLVAGGYGCSILPLHAISNEVSAGLLAYVRLDKPPLWRSAHLVHKPPNTLTNAAELIADQIVSVADDLVKTQHWAGAERL